MNCILKLTQSRQLEQFFAPTLRLLKCGNPASLLKTQANQSRYLSRNNVGDSQNDKSSIVKKLGRKKEYSVADDKLISKQIELYGRNYATGKKIAKMMGLSENSFKTILDRHKFHIVNKPTVKGYFSPHEDKTILDYVKKNGRSYNTIEDLTLLLGRGSPDSVRTRLLALSSGTVMEPKQWTLEEDKIMVKYIVKNFLVKNSNDLPEQIKISDFESLTLKMQRSPKSAYTHYYQTVLPILKTHTRGLPMEENWMCQKHLMQLIIERKIEKSNDISYYDLLAESSFVGQTHYSLNSMVKKFDYKTQNNKSVLTNDILWKRVEKSYYDKTPQLLCFSEKRQAQKLERIHNIIEAYESAKNNQL